LTQGDIAMSGSRAIGFIAKEFREALPPILFFFVTFKPATSVETMS